jgi:hypothetical protein
LRPWIALIVLEEGTEFKEGSNLGERPLPFVVVDDPARFPPAGQLWAWAHVHVNRSMVDAGIRTPAIGVAVPVGTDPSRPAVQRLEQTLDENADLAYSRLICPRKLKDNTPYHACCRFLRAGDWPTRLDPAIPEAMQSAGRLGGEEPDNHPHYYRWYFRTGTSATSSTWLAPKASHRGQAWARETWTAGSRRTSQDIDPALAGVPACGVNSTYSAQ